MAKKRGRLVGSGRRRAGDQHGRHKPTLPHRTINADDTSDYLPALACFDVTSREAEVAHLVSWYCGNKEVAVQLGISVSAVKQRMERLLHKLEVANRRELGVRVRLLVREYRSNGGHAVTDTP